MSNERERWLNVAQAAQWLAEGRAVQRLSRNAPGDWGEQTTQTLSPDVGYRLKPEPPKPREWTLLGTSTGTVVLGGWVLRAGEQVFVQEVVK